MVISVTVSEADNGTVMDFDYTVSAIDSSISVGYAVFSVKVIFPFLLVAHLYQLLIATVRNVYIVAVAYWYCWML